MSDDYGILIDENGVGHLVIGSDLNDMNTPEEALKKAYEKGKADAIDECIKFLIDYFGVAEVTKYGNKTKEQREISYSVRMNYEIREGIEELEGLKGRDINVPTKKEGEQK